jgi:predicted aconitase with swiveling domain
VSFRAKIIQEWKGEISGEVLITRSKISFLGDVDLNTGMIVGQDIDVQGECIHDKIFIFSEGRGSTVGSNVLYGLAKKGLAPKLLATCRSELITISGAIMGGVPMISNLNEEVFEAFKTGESIKVFMMNGHAYLEKE